MRLLSLEARLRRLEGALKRDPKTWTIVLCTGELLEDEIQRQTKGEYLPGIDRLVVEEYGLSREVLDRI